MKRKCDDERRLRVLTAVGVAALVAGGAGYGAWQARQPSEWMRGEGRALAEQAAGVMASMETMGADLAGMSRGGEGLEEESGNVEWLAENSVPEAKGEAGRLRAAWESARGRERDRAAEIRTALGGETADAQRQQWEGLEKGLAGAKGRMESAVGGVWVWPGPYGKAKAGLEKALAEASRLKELRDAWAAARAEREGAYAALAALPKKAGLEAEGRGVSSRAGALLLAGGAMGADLEGMSRGVDEEEAKMVAWHVDNCEPGLRGTARQLADEWRAERGKERAGAADVASGLGNLGTEEMQDAWKRMMAAVENKKRALDASLEEMWEHPARYAAAKAELETALAEPERLWRARGEWAAARTAREEAYRGLQGLKKSDALVQGTREALQRFSEEASAAVSAAEQRMAAGRTERKAALANAMAQYRSMAEELRALHAANTNTVASVASSGLTAVGKALRELEEKRGEDERAGKEEFERVKRQTDGLLGQVQSQLNGLKGKDIGTPGIAQLCRDARACTNGYGDLVRTLAELQESEASKASKAAEEAGKQVSRAQAILEAARGTAADLPSGTVRVNAARAQLRRMLQDVRQKGNVLREQLDEENWAYAYGAERQGLWNEYEAALQWAEDHVPPAATADFANGNVLGDAERANEAAKRLAEQADALRQELGRRAETARALEAALARLETRDEELSGFETKTGGEDVAGNFGAELERLEDELVRCLEKAWTVPLKGGAADGAPEALRKEGDFRRRVEEAKARGEIGPVAYRETRRPGVLAWGPGEAGKGEGRVLDVDRESSSLRGAGFPGARAGGRGPFGMKFSVKLPGTGAYRVMVGLGKDSGHRLLGANTPRGESRDIHMATSLRDSRGHKETATRKACATTLSALVTPSKTPVAELTVQGWKDEWIDLEFEGEFDMDGVDWSHVYFGVYLADDRGRNPNNVVEKLTHVELERMNGWR